MTETASAVTFNHMYRHVPWLCRNCCSRLRGSDKDAAGNILETGKEGEVCMRGLNMMKGYLNNPRPLKKLFGRKYGSFWRYVLDEDGYLTIVDRLKILSIQVEKMFILGSGGGNLSKRRGSGMCSDRCT